MTDRFTFWFITTEKHNVMPLSRYQKDSICHCAWPSAQAAGLGNFTTQNSSALL